MICTGRDVLGILLHVGRMSAEKSAINAFLRGASLFLSHRGGKRMTSTSKTGGGGGYVEGGERDGLGDGIHCRVLQSVAGCCGVLQCVAALCCIVLHCVAVCCSVLQGVAVCCNGGLV